MRISNQAQTKAEDLLKGNTGRLAWGLPQVLFLLGFLLPSPVRSFVWPIALGFLGALCLYNARRCGRLHCYLTGPLYLAAAFLVVLEAQGILSLGRLGWLWLGIAIVLLGNVLTIIPEKIMGEYIGT